MRAATLLLATIVTAVGLWGVSHADELGMATPAAASSTVETTSIDVAVAHLVDTSGEPAVSEGIVIGVVTCLLGIVCGFALATLFVFVLRCRQLRLQRQRPHIAPITAAAAFNHRGRHRFGLHNLSLLRI